jgi:hypothetical protein
MQRAPTEEWILSEIAILDDLPTHLAGAVRPVVERDERAVHSVEQPLGCVEERAVVVHHERIAGVRRSCSGTIHRRGTLVEATAARVVIRYPFRRRPFGPVGGLRSQVAGADTAYYPRSGPYAGAVEE